MSVFWQELNEKYLRIINVRQKRNYICNYNSCFLYRDIQDSYKNQMD